MGNSGYRFPSAKLFWCLGFMYASFMALMLQKVVLPLMPEMHAGHGLLPNDAIVFHNIAVDAAEKIRSIGWSEWKLFPGAAGNVGVLSALYALLGPDPAWFIPINAAAHTTGALLIYRIGARLWPGATGMLGGLIAGIAFLAFPSALQWYGQNHKDAFAIAGILLVLDAWLSLQADGVLSWRAWALSLVGATIGAALLGLVRPYYPVVLVCALVASYVIASLVRCIKRGRGACKPLLQQLVLIFAVMAVAFAYTKVEIAAGVYGEGDSPLLLQQQSSKDMASNVSPEVQKAIENWRWNDSEILPTSIDRIFRRASELRRHFVAFGRSVGAGSEVDGDRLPNDVWSSLAYMPRALVVGLFAPFPTTWVERVSAPRLIGAVETAVWYLFALGFVFTIRRRPSMQLVAGIVFCAVLLVMLAYIHPNVGTLYRQRFGAWLFFFLCGALGWGSVILGILQRKSKRDTGVTSGSAADVPLRAEVSSGMDRLAASGALVILVTLLCYLGFLARDLLLVKHLGLEAGLDAFFTAAMIPMFFVTFLAMPIADALMVPFLSARFTDSQKDRQHLLSNVLGMSIVILAVTTIVVIGGAPFLVSYVLGDAAADQIMLAGTMLRWFAPIILLSAWTVVGNAVLNAQGYSKDAALGQLVVPVITIVGLVFMPAKDAAVAAIAGMVLGTLLNVLWVVLRLRAHGIALVPRVPSFAVLRPVTASYNRLAFAALLTAILVPLNYTFAASVASGAVSAWALANKIVVLFSGLASVGASAIVLPHLARLFSHGHRASMRDDAMFLLVAGSWVGGGLSVGALLFAEPLVAAALSGSLTQDQVVDLANVVKVGVLQLPVAIAGALVTKMAIVSGAPSRVLFAAVAGFVCNFLVNLYLVPHLGVMGVAVGALSAMTLSTLSLIIAARKQIGLSIKELLTLFVSWLVWGGVCVAVASQSTAAIVCAALAVFGMAWAQFNTWTDTEDSNAEVLY